MTHLAALLLLGLAVLALCIALRPHAHRTHQDGQQAECREYWERGEPLPALRCWRRYDALP